MHMCFYYLFSFNRKTLNVSHQLFGSGSLPKILILQARFVLCGRATIF